GELPDEPQYRQLLAQDLNDLAIALASSNRLREVEDLWQEAIGLQEKLVAAQPKNADYWQDLVNTRVNLVAMLHRQPLTAKLEKECRQLVDVQERRDKAF